MQSSSKPKNNRLQMANRVELTCVSLFSGAMGLDLGLERAGFRVAMAADNMPAAIATIRRNRPELPIFDHDIRNLTSKDVYRLAGLAEGNLDLLAGGPPCQSFSTAGKRLGLDDTNKGALVAEFVRLVRELKPKAFLMENVKGFLSASVKWRKLPYNNNGKRIDNLYGSLFRSVVQTLEALGYTVAHAEINAADYGVPQRRTRVFLMGFRNGVTPSFPPPTHAMTPGLFLEPWETIDSYISGIKEPGYCAKFSSRKLKYLKQIPPGGNWRDLSPTAQKESMGKAYFAKRGTFWLLEKTCLEPTRSHDSYGTSKCKYRVVPSKRTSSTVCKGVRPSADVP